MISFRGLNDAFETKEMTEWCIRNGYTLKIFGYTEINSAIKYVSSLKNPHIEVWGYSRGAVSGYDLCRLTPKIRYARLYTIGSYHTVTSSFGRQRPRLSNVRRHRNFIETHQQPKGFYNNKINVSLGPVSHFEATKKALEKIDGQKCRISERTKNRYAKPTDVICRRNY